MTQINTSRAQQRQTFYKFIISMLFVVATSQVGAHDLNIYGAGDSSPPYKEAAAQFEQQTGYKTHIVAGPVPAWIDAAKNDADLIFTGSESMMSQVAASLDSQINLSEVQALYLRKIVILVRPGNPKHIRGFSSLEHSDLNVQVGNAPGIFGVWEDMAGKSSDISELKALRQRIVNFAPTSAEGTKYWVEHPEVDAWITWNVFQVAHPELGDVVTVEEQYTIFRDTATVVTQRGHSNPAAEKFLAFLKSPAGVKIFARKGWLTGTDNQ